MVQCGVVRCVVLWCGVVWFGVGRFRIRGWVESAMPWRKGGTVYIVDLFGDGCGFSDGPQTWAWQEGAISNRGVDARSSPQVRLGPTQAPEISMRGCAGQRRCGFEGDEVGLWSCSELACWNSLAGPVRAGASPHVPLLPGPAEVLRCPLLGPFSKHVVVAFRWALERPELSRTCDGVALCNSPSTPPSTVDTPRVWPISFCG